jgi:hypothetical protein
MPADPASQNRAAVRIDRSQDVLGIGQKVPGKAVQTDDSLPVSPDEDAQCNENGPETKTIAFAGRLYVLFGTRHCAAKAYSGVQSCNMH